MNDEAIRIFIITKIGWIKKQQKKYKNQPRQYEREYVSGESVYLWENRYRLELAKKYPQCLEYVIVYELVYLLEKKHNKIFKDYMDKFLPGWITIKEELNALILDYMEDRF